MKMIKRKSPYFFMAVCMLVSALICTFVSYYSTGVVMRSNAKRIIDERIEIMTGIIEKGYKSENETKEKISEEYTARAKMTAMMILQSMTDISDENFLEEIRIAVNADEISITNYKGVIEYSTSYNNGDYCEEQFLNSVSNRNFTDVIIRNNEIVTGTARLDRTGIIQIKFLSENNFDISDTASEYPLLDKGCTAIIDCETYTYLSHTDNSLIDKTVQIPKEEFSGKKFTFYSFYKGSKVMVRYKIYEGYIILGMIPITEIYSTRNAITVWVLIISIIMGIVACLSFRKHLIDNNEI